MDDRQLRERLANKIIADCIGPEGAQVEVIAGELGPASGPELNG